MRYLVDTCCISELIKPRPDPGVQSWFAGHEELDLYLSVVTLGELRYSIDRLPESARKEKMRKWVDDELEERFRDRVLPITTRVSQRWGRLRASLEAEGRPHPVLDLWIAATAFEHDLTVVTRNVKDYRHTGVSLINPWDSP